MKHVHESTFYWLLFLSGLQYVVCHLKLFILEFWRRLRNYISKPHSIEQREPLIRLCHMREKKWKRLSNQERRIWARHGHAEWSIQLNELQWAADGFWLRRLADCCRRGAESQRVLLHPLRLWIQGYETLQWTGLFDFVLKQLKYSESSEPGKQLRGGHSLLEMSWTRCEQYWTPWPSKV